MNKDSCTLARQSDKLLKCILLPNLPLPRWCHILYMWFALWLQKHGGGLPSLSSNSLNPCLLWHALWKLCLAFHYSTCDILSNPVIAFVKYTTIGFAYGPVTMVCFVLPVFEACLKMSSVLGLISKAWYFRHDSLCNLGENTPSCIFDRYALTMLRAHYECVLHC